MRVPELAPDRCRSEEASDALVAYLKGLTLSELSAYCSGVLMGYGAQAPPPTRVHLGRRCCAICGNPLPPRDPSTTGSKPMFCGPECKRTHHRERQRARRKSSRIAGQV